MERIDLFRNAIINDKNKLKVNLKLCTQQFLQDRPLKQKLMLSFRKINVKNLENPQFELYSTGLSKIVFRNLNRTV